MLRNHSTKIKYFVPGLCWALFILLLSVIPPSNLPELNWNILAPDKLAHTFFYAVFTILLIYAFSKQEIPFLLIKRIVLSGSIALLYGIVIEIIQGTIFVYRSMEMDDVLANTIGVFIGVLIYLLLKNKVSFLMN